MELYLRALKTFYLGSKLFFIKTRPPEFLKNKISVRFLPNSWLKKVYTVLIVEDAKIAQYWSSFIP